MPSTGPQRHAQQEEHTAGSATTQSRCFQLRSSRCGPGPPLRGWYGPGTKPVLAGKRPGKRRRAILADRRPASTKARVLLYAVAAVAPALQSTIRAATAVPCYLRLYILSQRTSRTSAKGKVRSCYATRYFAEPSPGAR